MLIRISIAQLRPQTPNFDPVPQKPPQLIHEGRLIHEVAASSLMCCDTIRNFKISRHPQNPRGFVQEGNNTTWKTIRFCSSNCSRSYQTSGLPLSLCNDHMFVDNDHALIPSPINSIEMVAYYTLEFCDMDSYTAS
ncbi:hypothetical protein L2E82_47636 [Cichorium intybus]|uniref:Uncharacterized protein n=1 Tax=Cichorium intybus TaxID=13427 RepID=A0ACB8YWR7_CICIN|nr:hypothetical protein L2E82_47636 [Cichorium intybus]